jgi:hypothetical protein
LIVERDGLHFVAKKGKKRLVVIDEHVDACVTSSRVRPRADIVEKIIADGGLFPKARDEDVGKREHDAG